MLIEILSAIVIAYALVYLLITAILAYGELRVQPGALPEALPSVSIILCARNEEHNLPRCLDSLAALDYPSDTIEIITVDDESSDRTLDILRRYSEHDARFQVFSTRSASRALIGKQRPLNLGIGKSRGEIVFVVDADISVRPDWVKSHIAAYGNGVGVVGGTTRIDTRTGGLFARLQAVDLISKIAVSMGCAGLGMPLTIMGNNISFLRKAYDEVGGFEKMRPRIVEDLALLNAITRQAGYRLGWAAGKGGAVDSMPEGSLDTFLHQRRRWLKEVGDMSLIGKMTIWIEVGMNIAFFAAILVCLFSQIPLTAVGVAWIAGYWIVLSANPGATVRDRLYIPLMLLFQLYYAALIGRDRVKGRRTVVWKGRKYG